MKFPTFSTGTPEDGVHEAASAPARPCGREGHCLVDRGRRGNPVQMQDLVEACPEAGAEGRLDAFQGSPGQLLQVKVYFGTMPKRTVD